jgi:hypothetical protein
MTKLSLSIMSALVLAGLAAALVIQHQTQLRLRGENESLLQQNALLVRRQPRTNDFQISSLRLTN